MPRKKKRYSLLGCKFTGTAKRLAQRYADDFCGLGRYPVDYNPLACREDDLRYSLNAVTLRHLEYPYVDIESAERFL